MSLYPYTFHPQYIQKVWGGAKHQNLLGRDTGGVSPCGESWEVSTVKGHVSVVSNGPEKGKTLTQLMSDHKEALLGKKVHKAYGGEFPLLIKYLDAADDLSVQVHPDDKLAAQRHDGKGKTEMWYVLQADPRAELIFGFNKETSKSEYLKYLEEGRIMDLMHREPTAPGDVFYIPAGRVHAIGKGILLAEIQQTSDITYRIYDFDRPDTDGKLRELHTEMALDAIDFSTRQEYKTRYTPPVAGGIKVVESPYFHTEVVQAGKNTVTRDYRHRDSFTIFIGVEGAGTIKTGLGSFKLATGGVYLLPAAAPGAEATATSENFKFLETYIP